VVPSKLVSVMTCLDCNVVNIGRHDIVLGMSWLRKHGPLIDWPNRKVNFISGHCSKNCLAKTATAKGDVLENTPGINTVEENPKLNLELIPEPYRDLVDVFAEGETVTELPLHRPYDLRISLTEGARPRHSPIYKTTAEEEAEMEKTIKAQLEQGLIIKSQSPMTSPKTFARKKNGKLRMCVNYWRMNAMTKCDPYPLPLTDELIERL
jgi:hypothetical protein